jgi:hypothetical protein
VFIYRCNLCTVGELRSVHALQHAAYAVEAVLISTRNIPGLTETSLQLAARAGTFWGCFDAALPYACRDVIATEPAIDQQNTTRTFASLVRPWTQAVSAEELPGGCSHWSWPQQRAKL